MEGLPPARIPANEVAARANRVAVTPNALAGKLARVIDPFPQ